MNQFPYLAILKKAYEITRQHFWLWIFGLFVGGTFSLNFSPFFSRPPRPEQVVNMQASWTKAQSWISSNWEIFSLLVALVLLGFLCAILVSGIAKGAIIWASQRLVVSSGERAKEKVDFRSALKSGRLYLWRIIGLQLGLTASFFILFLVFFTPVVYLFIAGVSGRGLVLLLLGLLIFAPASLVIGFLHLYGPIFIVFYDFRINEALVFSFNLVRHKLRESMILAAFLLGLNIVFLLGLAFSVIVFTLPVALLGWLVSSLGFGVAMYMLVFGTILIGFFYVIVLSAGFTAFENVTWVLAVQEMVKAMKIDEQEEALAAEPA